MPAPSSEELEELRRALADSKEHEEWSRQERDFWMERHAKETQALQDELRSAKDQIREQSERLRAAEEFLKEASEFVPEGFEKSIVEFLLDRQNPRAGGADEFRGTTTRFFYTADNLPDEEEEEGGPARE